jgi:hypothetical protein
VGLWRGSRPPTSIGRDGDPGILDVLAEGCGLVSNAVRDLSEEAFTGPTRCPPGDVKVLVGHMWRDMDRLRTGLPQPPPDAAGTTDREGQWPPAALRRRARGLGDLADRFPLMG